MSDHVSQLVLDELVVGLPVAAEAKAHVDSCADCTARLEALQKAKADSIASFGYARTLARISAPSAAPSGWRWFWSLSTPLVTAIAVFIFLGLHPPDGAGQLKGSASLRLLGSNGAAVSSVHPGAHVKLEVGAAGFTHGLALGLEENGNVEQLWPEAGADDRLPGTGIVTLPRELEATPGSVTVYVLLSNTAIDAARAKADLPAAVRAAAASVSQRLEVVP
jgi:hypothetical protein